MKVKFCGKEMNLKNEIKAADAKNKFLVNIFGLKITAEKFDGDWEISAESETEFVVYEFVSGTKTEAIQKCFNRLEEYLDDLKETIGPELNFLELVRRFSGVQCPYCKSKRIFKFRLNSDWAMGAGNYEPATEETNFTKEELDYDSFDRPSINVYHCLDFGRIFE